ncbi:hypothetical protein [Sphaerisporangium krabiense]|uniref:Uncharacterized protein n=1 Tax=Sphaerisporangium krabiense TaxID=763782 RepID=A0A7W8ZAG8_9ACTN|nr:hypothetical protein [Sphaerisporangium krabiense]MBB5630462.1 hypothetical protein [Sphaerisporangium krabiense]
MSGKGAGIAVALIGAGAAIIAALITSDAPICPDFICGPDKATAQDRPSGGSGGKQIIKVPGGAAGVEITPTEITCTAEGGCDSDVRIESVGDATLKVTYMEVTGEGRAHFSKDGGCERKNLAPGVVCSFGVTFTPPSDGAAVQATLVIHHNVGAHPTRVTLKGEASNVPTEAPPSEFPTDG